MNSSSKLSVYEFGRQLLETRDLDPVYVMLWEAKLDPDLLRHWLLAYWCFYHSGTASWVCSIRADYWTRMEIAAASKEYPRCPERRHFRGDNARKSVAYLASQGIERLWKPFSIWNDHCVSVPVAAVMREVQEWTGFGPWIAFKVADMLERLNLVPVQFDDSAAFLFDSPREGAKLMWETEGCPSDGFNQEGVWAIESILGQNTNLGLRRYKAPPRYERIINSQEAETILCKWKSYMAGRYEVGEDIEALHKSLLRFPCCAMTGVLIKAGKRGGLWS